MGVLEKRPSNKELKATRIPARLSSDVRRPEEREIPMVILVDTGGLLDLLERDDPCTVDECNSVLRAYGGSVVITLTHVREMAAPLELAPPGHLPVTSTLNKLEILPLIYADEVTIPQRELEEAVEAFRAGREPRPLDPFVDRLDAAAPFQLPTRRFLNYPLAEIALDVWHHRPDIFRKGPRLAATFRAAVEDRRSRRQSGGDLAEFTTLLPDLAARMSLDFTGLKPADLAQWLWQDPRRCPGILLWFRVRHQLMRNRTDKIKDSDLADLNWPWLLPYVNLATLDGRMRHYVGSVISEGRHQPCAKIFSSVAEVIDTLKSAGAPNNSLERPAQAPPLSS